MYHRTGCGIEDFEDNKFIITGGRQGSKTTNRVTMYDTDGQYTDMPTLNTARSNHACGTYRNNNQEKVWMIWM